MRNIFDQYSQPENKLTHALVCTLQSDRSLLRPFLRWVGARDVPSERHLFITEQQVPGEALSGDEEEFRKGLPDACVYTNDGWALLVESKVTSPVSLDQLRRHIATAEKHGFESPHLLLLSVDDPPKKMPPRTTHQSWREVYAWFGKHAKASDAAQTFTEYMEIFESKMIDEDYDIRGTLTMFTGLKFDENNPYTYLRGKSLIRQLGDELQKRKDLQKIGVDPKGERRPKITGRSGTRVWDFLPLKCAKDSSNFTAYPHLTLGLGLQDATAAITVPNGVQGGFKKKLKEAGEEGFFDLLMDIEKRTRPILKKTNGSRAVVYATQRHYRSQSSEAETDARLDVDLRTITRGKRREAKYQPEWVQAIYDVLTQKRSNIQFGVQIHLPYECPIVQSPQAVDLFAQSWIAMWPIIKFVVDE